MNRDSVKKRLKRLESAFNNDRVESFRFIQLTTKEGQHRVVAIIRSVDDAGSPMDTRVVADYDTVEQGDQCFEAHERTAKKCRMQMLTEITESVSGLRGATIMRDSMWVPS